MDLSQCPLVNCTQIRPAWPIENQFLKSRMFTRNSRNLRARMYDATTSREIFVFTTHRKTEHNLLNKYNLNINNLLIYI